MLRIAVILFLSAAAHAQTDDSWKVYDDSQVARVDVTIDPAALAWIYAHVESDSEHVATVRFRNAWINETMDSVGFRLRGNTSRDAKKKSFKVSYNSFIKGRKLHGVEKLNLNGEHNDPSIIRSKLCFDLYQRAGMRASRAAHAEVYINGAYYGLYVSVEHIDEEFLRRQFADDSGNLWKCLYPADLNDLGSDPNIYRTLFNTGDNRPVYELSTNEEQADFSALARLIGILNRTSNAALPDSLEPFFDIPNLLQYFAMNILVGSWDDYWSLMNNYYLYYEPARGRFTLIPYDYDNTFGIDWFGITWANASPYSFNKVVSGSRPLAERLMANARYRDLYTHILRFLRDRVVLWSTWEARLDSLRARIESFAAADTFRTKDYGFTMNDFNNSYIGNPYQNQHVKMGIKQFVLTRQQSILGQLSYLGSNPSVYAISASPILPRPADSIQIDASCFASRGIKSVQLQYDVNNGGSPQTMPMAYTPVLGTERVAEADRWTTVLPPVPSGGRVDIRIVITDSTNAQATYPIGPAFTLQVSQPVAAGVVINEFLASNTTIPDQSGDFDDYLELYNASSSPVLLTGMYLTDNPSNRTKWQFTQSNLALDPGAHLVVWCDEQETQTGLHSNFKLGASGEYIALTAADGITVLDSLTFGPQSANTSYARVPDGGATWTFRPPTPGSSNGVTGVEEHVVPERIEVTLYPNPFNPNAVISIQLSAVSWTDLRVFDLLGREVAMLVNEVMQPGTHRVVWNAEGLPSGMYLVRLVAGGTVKVVKGMVVK